MAAAVTETRVGVIRERYSAMASIAQPIKGLRAYWNWCLAILSMAFRTSKLHARPLKLTFDPANVCQLRCPLCPTGLQIHDRAPERARMHVFEHLMEEVGDYVFFLDLYNWGEPLLNKDLEEMLRAAAAKKIVTTVSTNLSLPLSDERIYSLVTSGVSEIIVSIDGTSQESYGTYRRKGDFDLAFKNMCRILEMKKKHNLKRPAVVWRYYVFRFNEHEISRARELAAEIGVDRVVFGTPFLDDGRFPLSREDREAMETWPSTLPEFNRYQSDHPEYEAPGTVMEKRNRCDWHYISTAINPDGGVAPCCAVFEEDNDFGSLEDGSGSYMELVNNEPFTAIRDRFAGRRAESTDLVCEECPTPAIMDYGKVMNRQIAFLTIVQIAEGVRSLFRRSDAS